VNSLKDKHILVTGAAGFVGANLVRKLLQCGARVTGMDIEGASLWRLEDVLDRIEVVKGDLRNFNIQGLKEKVSDVQIIYHLGAIGIRPTENAGDIFETNIGGTYRMLQFARQVKAQRFIYCGSCFEYGEGENLTEDTFPKPISEYGSSKVAAWTLTNMFARRYSLPVVSLRLFTPYGPFEDLYRFIPHVIVNALEGTDIELTGGEQTRDFVFIDDVCDAFIAAGVTPGIEGDTFNISGETSVAIKDVVAKILELTRSKAKPLFGAHPYRDNELWKLSGDASLARHKLKWAARVSLEDGLDKAIQWFKESRDKNPVYTKK